MISSFQVRNLFCQVGWDNAFEFKWTWRKVMSDNYYRQTSHDQTLIGLHFSKNAFHWSKFEARPYDIFFSWTFDLFLINSSNYFLFVIYFSLNQRNTVYKYKLQKKPIIKEIQTDLHFYFPKLLISNF